MTDLRPLQYDIKWDVYEGMPITDINFKQLVLFRFYRNYSLVIDFMWQYGFMNNIVYEGVGLHEMEEMKEIYSNYCLHILRNECSVMMLSQDETQVIAVALLEWMTEEIYLPSVVPNGLFQELILLRKGLMYRTKEQQEWEKIDSLMVLELGFTQEMYEDQNLQICMFDVFGAVAQHMHMPRICFIALTVREQMAAELAEFEEYGRSIYSIYKVGNQRPFDVLRDLDEMYAVLFVLALEPILFYRDMPGFEVFHAILDAQERKQREEEMARNTEIIYS
ncbi:hypothetical protein KR222_002116 [Zaprionus bogoriensis]|nr:hypothetical protein KR222_002116 [Zaprionus bogoriensis]